MRTLNDTDFSFIETWLKEAFHGKLAKNGEPEADHSIRIGRALRADGADDITVFGGYFHDVTEDTPNGRTEVRAVALGLFEDDQAADAAADLVEECSYSADEYEMPKLDRKAAACARWISTDNPRVAPVKIADVEDNRNRAACLPHPFEVNYLAWADPLQVSLRALVRAREAGAPRI